MPCAAPAGPVPRRNTSARSTQKPISVPCSFNDSFILPAKNGKARPVLPIHQPLLKALQETERPEPWQATASAIVRLRREWYGEPQRLPVSSTRVKKRHQKLWRATQELKDGQVCCNTPSVEVDMRRAGATGRSLACVVSRWQIGAAMLSHSTD